MEMEMICDFNLIESKHSRDSVKLRSFPSCCLCENWTEFIVTLYLHEFARIKIWCYQLSVDFFNFAKLLQLQNKYVWLSPHSWSVPRRVRPPTKRCLDQRHSGLWAIEKEKNILGLLDQIQQVKAGYHHNWKLKFKSIKLGSKVSMSTKFIQIIKSYCLLLWVEEC